MLLTKEQWYGIARHVLGAAGGIAGTIGLLNAEQITVIAGAALSLLAVGLSIRAPEKLTAASDQDVA